jgi:hypothetical protein
MAFERYWQADDGKQRRRSHVIWQRIGRRRSFGFIGTKAHMELFCGAFLSSHEAYAAGEVIWPELGGAHIEAIRLLPIWGQAIANEAASGAFLERFGEEAEDALMREAIQAQAREEARHAEIMRCMLRRYEVNVPNTPEFSFGRGLRREFMDGGYRECMDVFLGYGFYRMACNTCLFPSEILTIFDRILEEETRHIVFFVNWAAYMGLKRKLRVPGATIAQAIGGLVRAISRIPKGMGKAGEIYYATSGLHAHFEGWTLRAYLEACLEEHESRMAQFDDRLLRPELVPGCVRIALRTLPGSVAHR